MNQNKIKIIAVLLLLCISAAWLERYEIQESGQNLSGQMADKMKQNTDEPQNLYAQSAVLMDADSGRVLFGKEEEAIRPMASTTKIRTCSVRICCQSAESSSGCPGRAAVLSEGYFILAYAGIAQ